MPPGLKPDRPDCGDKDECPSDGRRRLVIALVVAVSVLVFLSIVSLSIYCFIRHRRRQQREALLAAGPAVAVPAANLNVDDGGGPEGEQGGGEEVVHHAWHIGTVGLDETVIQSIALTRYRAGAGMLGAADCSVCLGEFRDGELLRLLPNCGHAFHVPCVDTWLRAHVNCPLCRADVLDPVAASDSDPPAGANFRTVAEQASNNIESSLHEQSGPGQQQNGQQELRLEIDQCDQSRSPEPPHRHPISREQNFRRLVSMDSSLVPAGETPEDDQNSKEKQGERR